MTRWIMATLTAHGRQKVQAATIIEAERLETAYAQARDFWYGRDGSNHGTLPSRRGGVIVVEIRCLGVAKV